MSDMLFDPGPPVCHVCGGRGMIFSKRMGMDVPCPECGAKEGMDATDHAHDASEEWKEKAEATVRSVARRQAVYTMDDIMGVFLNVYPDLQTHGDRDEKRRWGPLMRRLVKQGVHVKTGEFVLSHRRHSSPIPVWKSLLWSE